MIDGVVCGVRVPFFVPAPHDALHLHFDEYVIHSTCVVQWKLESNTEYVK